MVSRWITYYGPPLASGVPLKSCVKCSFPDPNSARKEPMQTVTDKNVMRGEVSKFDTMIPIMLSCRPVKS
jgi:hypothetical protein